MQNVKLCCLLDIYPIPILFHICLGPFLWKCLYQVRVITFFPVFRLWTDFVCLYNYEFWLSLCKIVRSSVILLLPLLENISNLITSPSSYQCIRRKTRWVHFVIHGRHISMECMCAYWGSPCKFSKQMIKKYLVTEYLFITEGEFLF